MSKLKPRLENILRTIIKSKRIKSYHFKHDFNQIASNKFNANISVVPTALANESVEPKLYKVRHEILNIEFIQWGGVLPKLTTIPPHVFSPRPPGPELHRVVQVPFC